MALLKLARRLLSLKDAREFWSASPTTTLGVEQMEDRTTPAVTAAVAGSVLTLVNDDAANEGVTVDTTTNAGFITVLKGATGTNNVTAGAGTAATGTGAKVAVGGITGIIVSAGGAATKFLDMTVNNITGATALRAVTYTSGSGNDDVVLTASGNASVYYKVDVRGGTNTFKAADAGVNVLVLTDSAAASSVAVTPSTTNGKTALDFRNVTTDVAVNLNVGPNGSLGSYGKMNVTLAAGATDASKIIGIYGGKGNDTLIGNSQDNFLVGGDGSDTLIGNGGNDQLNANRDFSPAMPGSSNTAGVATTTATSILDMTTFGAISASLAGLPGQNPTAAAVFSSFGFFSFGEGVAAIVAGGVTSASTGADFTTANAITAAVSNDTLVGGDGNDGHYGFNNARVSANGGVGNDVFSTNVNGLASTYDGGDGDDLLIGAAGFTLLGGAGNDNLSFAVTDPNAAQTNQSNANGGPGNDTLSVAFRNITIDAGEGTDTVGLGNFADDVLVFNGTTVITGGIGAFPLIKRIQR